MWLLAQLNRQGTTTLIATHDQTLLRDYATQAGVLHLDGKGGVVQQPIMSAHLSATVS
jgi:ABC-type ATPase involved in cell division